MSRRERIRAPNRSGKEASSSCARVRVTRCGGWECGDEPKSALTAGETLCNSGKKVAESSRVPSWAQQKYSADQMGHSTRHLRMRSMVQGPNLREAVRSLPR